MHEHDVLALQVLWRGGVRGLQREQSTKQQCGPEALL
jgi:hypothetical protein